MSSSYARSQHRERRTAIVRKFCKRFDIRSHSLNNGYQLRIENVLDVYPTNGRYCILRTNERGDWDTPADLKRLMLRALPNVKMYEVDKGEQPIHGIELTGVNTVKEHVIRIPPTDTAYLREVHKMSETQYNKWYRRVWRWLRGK